MFLEFQPHSTQCALYNNDFMKEILLFNRKKTYVRKTFHMPGKLCNLPVLSSFKIMNALVINLVTVILLFFDVTIVLNIRYSVRTQILVLHKSLNLLHEIIVTKSTLGTMRLKL